MEDLETLDRITDEGLGIAVEGGFGGWMAFGEVARAWVAFQRDPTVPGLAALRDRAADMPVVGIGLASPYFKTLEARACRQLGRLDEALSALAGARDAADQRDEHWWDAEIHRLTGHVLLARSSPAEAAAHFSRALDVARAQAARSLELRAAFDLALLEQNEGNPGHGFRALTECVAGLTEGLESREVRDALALLGALGGAPDQAVGRPASAEAGAG
jgi:predicted ATPase